MKVEIDIPSLKATPEMVKIMQNVCIGISADNLRKVDEKLTKLGAEKVNSKLKTGLTFI